MTGAFGHQALARKTIVLTRRPEDAPALAEALGALGAQVLVVPCLKTALLPRAIWADAMAALTGATCIAFASRQGVEALAEALTQGPWTLPAAAVLWAVGPATADAVRARWHKDVHLREPYTAEGLAQGLVQTLQSDCDNVVLPGAQQGRTHVAETLLHAGIAVRRLPLYATTPIASPRPALNKPVDYVVFTSPSTVAGWLLGGAHPPGARCISIGPTTSQALVNAGLVVWAQAVKPGTQGLIDAILENTQ